MATLLGFAPLAEDEPGYTEEPLPVRVALRQQYRKRHPPSDVRLASGLPTALTALVAQASVAPGDAPGAPRAASLSRTVATAPGTAPGPTEHLVPVDVGDARGRNALPAHEPSFVAIASGYNGPLSDASLPADREARLALLRERQRQAEALFH